MKISSPKIDRAGLLKGGATAALTAFLASTLEGSADACCAPIDLTYGDSGTLGTLSHTAYKAPVRRRSKGFNITGLSAVRIWAQGDSAHQIPPPDSSWKLLLSVPESTAATKGFDEEQRPHGNGKNGSTTKNLGTTIFIYVK